MQSNVRRSIFVVFAALLVGCEANTQLLGPDEAPTRVLMEVGGSAVYTDLGAFLAAAPGVVVEDFEGARLEEKTAGSCPGPFDSTTDNNCFAPGAIKEGISIGSPTVTNLAVLRTGFFEGLLSTVIGPDFFGAQADIAFASGDVNVAGFTLLAPVGGPGVVEVEVRGFENELLQSFHAAAGELSGIFTGVITDAPISRIVFTPPGGLGLLFDEIWFGSVAVPEGAGSTGVIVQVEPGAINPRSQGVIPVSLLTTDDFDATRIDPVSVRFGPGEARPHRDAAKISDVDGDGRLDIVLHFPTADAGFSCGDEVATLTGRTLDGSSFVGTASVRVLCLPDRGGNGGAGKGRR